MTNVSDQETITTIANCGAGYDELWVGTSSGSIRIYGETDGRHICTINLPTRAPVIAFTLSHVGNESDFWCACGDSSLHIVSISEQAVRESVRHAHAAPISCIQSTVGDTLSGPETDVPGTVWSAAADGSIRVWDAETCALVDTLTLDDGEDGALIQALLFFPGETPQIWAACTNGDVLVYESTEMRLLGSVPTDMALPADDGSPGSPVRALTTIQIARDRRGVCMAHEDATLTVWSDTYQLLDVKRDISATSLTADGPTLYLTHDEELLCATINNGRLSDFITLNCPRPAVSVTPSDTGRGAYLLDGTGITRWVGDDMTLDLTPTTPTLTGAIYRASSGVVASLDKSVILWGLGHGGVMKTDAEFDMPSEPVAIAGHGDHIWVSDSMGGITVFTDRLRILASMSPARIQELFDADLELPPVWSPPTHLFCPRTSSGKCWTVVGDGLLAVWSFRVGNFSLQHTIATGSVHPSAITVITEDSAGVWTIDEDATVVIWDVPEANCPTPRCAFRPPEAHGKPLNFLPTAHGLGLFMADGTVHFLEYAEGSIELLSTVQILHDEYEDAALAHVFHLPSSDIVMSVTMPDNSHQLLLFTSALILKTAHTVPAAIVSGCVIDEKLLITLDDGQVRLLHIVDRHLLIDHAFQVTTWACGFLDIADNRVWRQKLERTLLYTLGEVTRLDAPPVNDVDLLEVRVDEMHDVVEAELMERVRSDAVAAAAVEARAEMAEKLREMEAALETAEQRAREAVREEDDGLRTGGEIDEVTEDEPDTEDEGEKDGLRAEIEVLRATNRSLEETMVRVNRQSMERVREAERKVDQIAGAATESSRVLPKTQTELAEVTRKAERLEMELEAARQAKRDAEGTVQHLHDEQRALRERVAVAEAGVAEKSMAVQSLQADVARLAKTSSESAAEVESLRVERDEIANHAKLVEAALSKVDRKLAKRRMGDAVAAFSPTQTRGLDGDGAALQHEADTLRGIVSSTADSLIDTLERLKLPRPSGFPDLQKAVAAATDALVDAQAARLDLDEAGTAAKKLRLAVDAVLRGLGHATQPPRLTMGDELRACLADVQQLPVLIELGDTASVDGVAQLRGALTEAESTITHQQRTISQLETDMASLDTRYRERLATVQSQSMNRKTRPNPSVEYLTRRVTELEGQVRAAREAASRVPVAVARPVIPPPEVEVDDVERQETESGPTPPDPVPAPQLEEVEADVRQTEAPAVDSMDEEEGSDADMEDNEGYPAPAPTVKAVVAALSTRIETADAPPTRAPEVFIGDATEPVLISHVEDGEMPSDSEEEMFN